MGNVIADMIIRVRGEGQDAINEMDRVESRFSGLAAGMRKTGGIMTGIFTAPILAGGMVAFNMASDLQEAISATGTVYGEAADEALAWSKTTADAMGIARTEALTSINQFASFGKQIGLTNDELLDFSTGMVQSAADLASFWNTSTDDALLAIRSGLAGEMEPLKRYGIVIDELTIAKRAMAMTGKASAAALTMEEKAAARAMLIQERLGDAQGDFARTADGAANAKRRLIARTKDLTAAWGAQLLPIGLAIIKALLQLTGWFEKLSPNVQRFAMIIGVLVAALGPLLFSLGVFLPGIALLISPIGLLVLALTGLYLLVPGVSDAFKGIARVLGDLVSLFVDATQEGVKVEDLVKRFPEPLQAVARFVALVGDAFGDLYAAFTTGGVSGLLAALPGELAQLGGAFAGLAGEIMDALAAINWGEVLGVAVEGLKLAAEGGVKLGNLAIDAIPVVAGALAGAAGDFVGWLKRQLLGGGATGGDGTGGPGGGAGTGDLLLAIGNLAVDGLLALGEALAGIASDFGGWLWGKLTAAWDNRLAVGQTLLVGASLGINDPEATFAAFGGLVQDGAVAAIAGLSDLGGQVAAAIAEKIGGYTGWMTVITSDSFDVGNAVGLALRGAISATASIASDVVGGTVSALQDANWGEIVEKIGTGVTAALAGAVAVAGSIGLALASFLGGVITGLVFGEDADFGTVVDKIAMGIRNNFTADRMTSMAVRAAFVIWEGVQLAVGEAVDMAGDAIGYLAETLEGAVTVDNFTALAGAIVDAIWEGMKASAAGLNPVDLFTGGESELGGTATDGKGIDVPEEARKAFGGLLGGGLGKVLGAGAALRPEIDVTSAAASLKELSDKLTNAGSLAAGFVSKTTSQFATWSASVATHARTAAEQLRGNIESGLNRASASTTASTNQMTSTLGAFAGRAGQAGSQAGNSYAGSLSASLSNAVGVASGIVGRVRGALASDLSAPGYASGASYGQGLVNGMDAYMGRVYAAAAALANQILAGSNSVLRSASPSKAAMELGATVPMGYEAALLAGRDRVRRAGAALAGEALGDPGAPSIGLASRGGGPRVVVINALRSEEFEALLRKAENGSAFADEFANEFGA